MKKLVPFFAIMMISALVLGACTTPTPAPTAAPTEAPTAAPTEAPTAAPTEAPTEAPVVEGTDWSKVTPAKEIVFWHQHTGEAREAAMKAIVDGFNSTNEFGITLTAEYAGGYTDIFNKMLPILNTPDVPDIVVGYQNQIATYQLSDAFFDLNELMDDPTYGMPKADQEDFFPGFFAQDVYPLYGGQRLGLAPNRSSEVMYYNMDWLKELGYDAPPATPEQFKEMACKATTTPFSKAMGENKPIGYELSIDTSRFASWTFAFGGDIYDGTTNQYSLNSPAAVEAWKFIQGLFAEGCAANLAEDYGDQTDFGNGTLLFAVGSSSGLPYYGDAVTGGANFQWSVAPIPHTTAEPVQNVYGASVSVPKSTPERELAAWIFLKYYTSPDVQALWASASGYFPVRQSVAEKMATYMDENPTYKTAFDMLQYGYFEPAVPGYDFVREQVNLVMADIVDNPTSDVQAKLDELNTFANQSLAEQLENLQK